MEVTDQNILELRQQIIYQTTYCNARQKVLLDHAEEAKEKEYWTFN
jgi:hypothetical protein